MDELLYQSMDGMLTDMSHEFSSFMPASEVMEAVERVSDFFHIDNPDIVTEGFGTGVYTLDPTTMLDDILIYNPTQLESMGITGQDAVDLVMTHEGTHRMLQGMEVRFNSHQEELCCDYMAGVRAGLNNMDMTQLIDALGNTPESETHPAGEFRVAAIEAGMEFAHQFDQQPAPAFEECLEDFRNGTMQKYVELEHLKGEVDRLECEVRHYQRVLSAHPSDDLEEQYHPAFQKAPPSEISRLESKVNAARHEVDVKKQEVHERKMQNNYNPDTTTARRLAEAEKDLANAKSELKKAEYKLNEARRP